MTYDFETVYDEQIAPLMSRIIDICKEHGIPMLASFAYRCDEYGEHDCCTTFLSDYRYPAPASFRQALDRIYASGTEIVR